MGYEVSAAVGAALFTLLLVILFSVGSIAAVGLPTLLGNRENMPEFTGWLGRAQRAHANALENLVPFAIIAIAVQLSGVSNQISAIASLVFLGARIVHGLVYIAGLTVLRTVAWNVGVASTFATALPLVVNMPFRFT